MAWYLRKSLRMGPVRFNFSKSGVGVSAGVTGARIGVNSRGRGYTHVGRYGLYSRSSLGSVSSPARAPTSRRESVSVSEYADTNATFGAGVMDPRPTYRRPERPADRSAVPIGIGVVALALTAYFAARQSVAFDLAAISLGAAVIFGLLGSRSLRRRSSGDRLADLLQQKLLGAAAETSQDRKDIETALGDPRLSAADRDAITKRAFVVLVESVITSAQNGLDQTALVHTTEQLLGIPNGFADDVRLTGYRRAYVDAIADHKLTVEEERALEDLRNGLRISQEDISYEVKVVAELSRARALFDGEIPVVPAPVPLQKGETCHFTDRARILKNKVLRSYQSQGQRVKLEGLQIEAEGQIAITSKRLLVIHSGTTTIPLAKIMDVRVDPMLKVIEITKDGASKPVLITTPRAIEAGILLQKLMQLG